MSSTYSTPVSGRRDIEERTVRALFQYVFELRKKHAEYAREYRRGNYSDVIEAIVKDKFSNVTTYTYEPIADSPMDFSPKLLLATYIVENALLFRARGRLSNVTMAIVGMGGAGKTTYSILSSMGALILLSKALPDITPESFESMLSVLTFFDAESMVASLKLMIESKRWAPFMIIDDIGSQISKYWVFLGQHYWSYLFSVMDQMKDWSGAVIMTARRLESIASRLREISDIVVEARKVTTEDGVTANVYEFYRYEDYISTKHREARLRRVMYVDATPVTVKIPDNIWKRMMETRRTTGLKRVDMVYRATQLFPKIEEQQLEKMMRKLAIGGKLLGEGGEGEERSEEPGKGVVGSEHEA